MLIRAGKYHSFGNDFLVVEAHQVDMTTCSELAAAACDRHFGVGADGCLFVQPEGPADFSLRMFNPDGSEFGMTGNGVRCVAAYLHHRELTKGPELVFRTRSGVKRYRLLGGVSPRWTFRSAMGKPLFRPSEIPFQAAEPVEDAMDYALNVPDHALRVSVLNVGNPQCVVVVDELPGDGEFLELGAALERHPSFPERTNVSFLKVETESDVRIRIWERGVGPTHSSGTGACGAAVAAMARGLVRSPVAVHTQTGSQLVEWSPGQEILLTGESVFVAEVGFEWPQA